MRVKYYFFPLHTSNILGFIFTIWILQWKTGAHLAKFRIMTMVYVLYVHSKWMPVWKCQKNLQNCTKGVTMEIFCLCQLSSLLSLAIHCMLSVSWPLSSRVMNLILTATWEHQCLNFLFYRKSLLLLVKVLTALTLHQWSWSVGAVRKDAALAWAYKLKGQWQDQTQICPTCLTSCLARERMHTQVW